MMNAISETTQNPAVYLSRIPMSTIQQQKINFSENNEWDICYKYSFPYNVLCNFSPSSFVLDKTDINSMEGFLQSLKISDPETQKKVCQLPGFLAKKVGNHLRRSSQYDGEHLYWQGKSVDRNSKDYQELLDKAYMAKYSYDKEFRDVLNFSKGFKLTHKIGKTSPEETVLTEEEFIQHLNTLRNPKSLPDILKVISSSLMTSIDNRTDAPTASRKLSKLKTTFINSNTMCGENIFKKEKPPIKSLKRAGIKNIIQTNIQSPEEQEAERNLCEKYGIKYTTVNFPCDSPEKFANEDLVNLINLRNENATTYICCDLRQECNPALALNYLFNPKANLADALLFGSPRKKTIQHISRTVLKHITPETKELLGWNDKFEENLPERQKTLFGINE